MNERSLVTLFSGGGLADIGAAAAGFTPVAAVEWDEKIAEVYALNHGRHILCAPVEEVDYRPYEGIDAGWVSPCCTNASQANQDGEESDQDLSAAGAVCRFLCEARPRAFVLENVWAYRNFASFALILETLSRLGYRWEYQHVNAADYGVPQTRKRLILRAVREGRLRPLTPTHCEGGSNGGLFGEECGLLPWVGWYAAVEDLIPDLPESQFAEWQLKRLPAELSSVLANPVDGLRSSPSTPAWSVMASEKTAMPKALLVDGDNAGKCGPISRPCRRDAGTVTCDGKPPALLIGDQQGRHLGDGEREAHVLTPSQPAMTVRAQRGGGTPPRAFLIDGQQTTPGGNGERAGIAVPDGDAPALTVPASAAKGMPRAVLVSTNTQDGGAPPLREGEGPALTVDTKGRLRALLVDSAGYADETGARVPGDRDASAPANTVLSNHASRGMRAWTEYGRVVAMTPRCLARFQSVPDSYELPAKTALACRVIGNGVPSLLARRVMESLRED